MKSTQAHASTAPMRELQPLRVLVLDDEPGIGRLVAEGLGGHIAEVFTQPRRALERASEVPFDFVFCDFSMPEMTGLDFYEALVQVQPDLAHRFVLMTGSAYTRELEAFLLRTQVELLPKPFVLRALRPIVDGACRRQSGILERSV